LESGSGAVCRIRLSTFRDIDKRIDRRKIIGLKKRDRRGAINTSTIPNPSTRSELVERAAHILAGSLAARRACRPREKEAPMRNPVKSQTPHFKTEPPRVSEAALARVRAAAHRYIVAGGSIFPNVHDGDRDAHTGNVVREISKRDALAAFNRVLDAELPEHAAHERVYNAVMDAMIDHETAAFFFGAIVGLEMASLTPSIAQASRPISRKTAGRKGGAR
jgi:hypothetical protein